MTTYFVSSAGSNTSPYDTEAKAATALLTTTALATASDTIKVSSTHTENAGGSITIHLPTSPGLKIVSVIFNGSGTGAAASGAAVNTNANSFFAMDGHGYVYGINFAAGTGSSDGSASIFIATVNQTQGLFFDTCTFRLNTSNSSPAFNWGGLGNNSNRDQWLRFYDCGFRFGATAQTIVIRNLIAELRGCSINASGSAPTTLFTPAAGATTQLSVIGSDLSGKTWTNFVNVGVGCASKFLARQCKMPASFAVSTGTFAGPGGVEVELIDCDSGDNHYTYLKSCWQGTIVASNTIYASTSNGTDSYSLHMTGNANSSFTWPLISPPIPQWNAATGSGKTTTVEVDNDGTTFTDAQLWQETSAKVTSGSTASTWEISDRAASIVASGTNQTTSSVSWTGTGGFGAEVKQKLVSGSFTPAEVGAVVTVVKLAANDDVYVSGTATLA